MANKTQTPEEKLFASAPESCKRLHAEAKKLLRERKRKEWWRKYGKDPQ